MEINPSIENEEAGEVRTASEQQDDLEGSAARDGSGKIGESINIASASAIGSKKTPTSTQAK